MDGEDEEVEWKTLQESMKVQQEKKKERVSKDSHPVHAPFFPDVRSSLIALAPLIVFTDCLGEARGMVALHH